MTRRRFLRELRGALLWGGAGVILAACGRPQALPPPAPELRVTVSASAMETQAVSRRWRASDIYQYEVSLRRWDGASFVDLSPPLTVVLPQKGEARHEARFVNLRHGERYRVDVLAKGNAGGTAPETLLNSEVPCTLDVDMRGAQDVLGLRHERVSVRLDPVPFAATVTLQPQNVPEPVQRFGVELREARGGATRYAGSFLRRQTMMLVNLRAGIDYQVVLEAYRANGRLLGVAESAVFRFDPEAAELEQERTLTIAF